MNIVPTVGRMVYYKSRGSADGVFPPKDRASIVTDVREVDAEGQSDGVGGGAHQVRLSVHNPDGLFFSDWLDQGQKPGNWDWMQFQKDQQMRPGYGESGAQAGGITSKAE